MDTFCRTLLDSDCLREGGRGSVSAPCMRSRELFPSPSLPSQPRNLTPDVHALLHFLPCMTEAGRELGEGEAPSTLRGQTVSCLHEGSRAFDRGDATLRVCRRGRRGFVAGVGYFAVSLARAETAVRVVVYDPRKSMITSSSIF